MPAPENTAELDDKGSPKVAPVKPEVKPEPKPDESKLQLTPEELEAKIQAGVAQALQAKQAEEDRKKAEEEGNYKKLLDDATAATRKANLALWRTKALKKYNLADNMFDALSGETEEEIMTAAKNLNSVIQEAAEKRAEVVREGNPPPPPTGVKKEKKGSGRSAEEVTRDNLSVAFGRARVAGRH